MALEYLPRAAEGGARAGSWAPVPPGHWALRVAPASSHRPALSHVWGTSGEDELWGVQEGQDFQDSPPPCQDTCQGPDSRMALAP